MIKILWITVVVKKNIFIDKVHICVSHEFVDTTLKVQISSDLAVDGTKGSITTTLSRGSCNRRYYLARGCNFLADKPYINISNLATEIMYEQLKMWNIMPWCIYFTNLLAIDMKYNVFCLQSAPGRLTTWRGSHVPGQTGGAGSAALTTGRSVTASTTARTRRTRTPTTVSSTKRWEYLLREFSFFI